VKTDTAGTHVHASEKHMAKYAKEFEYRYNARKAPENMFPELVNNFQLRNKCTQLF